MGIINIIYGLTTGVYNPFTSSSITPPPIPTGSGVISFAPIEILSHRYGADMTFSQQSDELYPDSANVLEYYGFKTNTRLGLFASDVNSSFVNDIHNTGLIRFDIYFKSQRWIRPGSISWVDIADYSINKWSSTGELYFDVVSGSSKPTRYPNHGQQMYDESNGRLGYDFSSGMWGTSGSAHFSASVYRNRILVENSIGRRTSGASYALGQDAAKSMLIPEFLGVRNSDPYSIPVISGSQHTFYGKDKNGNNLGWPVTEFTREYFSSYPSTLRYWDWFNELGYTLEQTNTYVQTLLQDTLNNKGWFRDFGHWHDGKNAGNIDVFEDLFQLVNTTLSGSFVWKCSNGEALEYMYIRDCASSPTASIVDGIVTITVKYDDRFSSSSISTFSKEVPKTLLNTPLSLLVNLSGSSLSGKNIQSSYSKVINKGNDLWVVEVPFNTGSGQFIPITLTESINTNGIFNINKPIISYSLTGSLLNVSTNMNTKAVLFSVSSSGAESAITSSLRSNNFNITHSFTLTSGRDYYIGALSEFGQASLSDKIAN